MIRRDPARLHRDGRLPIGNVMREDSYAAVPGNGRLCPLLIARVVAGFVLLAWRLADVLLLGFGGVFVAVLLRHLAQGLPRLTGLPTGASLVAMALGLAALAAVFVLSVGPQVGMHSVNTAALVTRRFLASVELSRLPARPR